MASLGSRPCFPQAFAFIGEHVSRRPKLTITVCIVVCVCVGLSNLFLYKVDTDNVSQWLSESDDYAKNRREHERLFGEPTTTSILFESRPSPYENTDWDSDRPRTNDAGGGRRIESMLDHLDVVYEIEAVARNIVLEHEGVNYTLSDVCLQVLPSGQCAILSVLDFYGLPFGPQLLGAIKADASPHATVSNPNATTYFGAPISRNLVMGAFEWDDAGTVAFAAGILTIFEVDARLPQDLKAAWDRRFVEVLTEKSKELSEMTFGNITIDIVSTAPSVVEDEGEEAAAANPMFLALAVACMIVFVAISASAHPFDLHRSRLHAGGAGIVCVGLGIIFGQGLFLLFGLQLNMITSSIPFFLLAIGIDDTFVVIHAYDSANPKLSPQKRATYALATAGPSITFTTMTDLAAFAVGTAVPFPAVRDWSILAILGLFSVYVLNILIVTAALSLDGKREQLGRTILWPFPSPLSFGKHDQSSGQAEDASDRIEGPSKPVIGDTPVSSVSSASAAHGLMSNGRSSTKTASDISSTAENPPPSNKSKPSKTKRHSLLAPRDKQQQTAHHLQNSRRRRLVDNLAGFVTHPVVRGVVAIGFLALFAACIYGLTQITRNFDITLFFADEDSSRKYLLAAFRLFGGINMGGAFILRNSTQLQRAESVSALLGYQQTISETQYLTPNSTVSFWLQGYVTYASMGALPANSSCASPHFYSTSDRVFAQCVHAFLESPLGLSYQTDVVFADDVIDQHQMTFFLGSTGESSDIIDLFDFYQDLAKDTFGLSPKEAYFEADWFFSAGVAKGAAEALPFGVGTAFAAIFVLVLIMLPIPSAAALLLVLCMTTVDTIGVLPLIWNIDVSPAVIAVLLMAIGFQVDYSAHIVHGFTTSPKLSRKDRVFDALHHAGLPVLLGGCSTFVGVVVLGFYPTDIFRLFFRIMVSIVIIGLAHGLVLLPAVLSIGPARSKAPRRSTIFLEYEGEPDEIAVGSLKEQEFVLADGLRVWESVV